MTVSIRRPVVPTWLKFTACAFLILFIASTWMTYGVVNFLWLSNLALIGTVAALVLEHRMLASMMLVMVLIPDGVAWTGDLLVAAVSGWHPLDATVYMFDERIPVRGRVMALYHPAMAAVLLWLVARVGYARRAFGYATALAWAALLVSYAATSPERNVNWVYGLGTRPQQAVAPWLYLLGVMAVVPTVLYLPTHVLMQLIGWDRMGCRTVTAANAPN